MQVGPPTEEGITIEFSRLSPTALLPKTYTQPSSAVTNVALHDNNGTPEIYIGFRNRGTTVKTVFLSAERPRAGQYRLVLDLFPGKGGPVMSETKPNPSSADSGTGKPALSKIETNVQGPITKGNAPSSLPQARKTPPAMPVFSENEQATILYRQADDYFNSHQNDLPQQAHSVIDLYTKALMANPRSSLAPQALYRCGLSYMAMGTLNKAEKFFQQIITEFPDHPMAAQGWLTLGQLYQQREAYIQAIEAFRNALRLPMDQADKALAHYHLGKGFSQVGAHKEAVETINQSLGQEPTLYLNRPDLFRYLGESSFALQQYDKSQEYLFRYLNLQPDPSNRDLILAKVAEIFLQQGDQVLANRLYNYIQNRYPDSEGDFISKIRKAELMEKRGAGGQDGAFMIYGDLAQKELPPSLNRVVHFKVASWLHNHGDYEKSLSLIEEALHGQLDDTAKAEFIALKDKTIVEWLKKRFSEGDHPKVIQLYEQYKPLFEAQHASDLDAMVAESYGMLKLYPKAIERYERLLAMGKKKNDDWLMKASQYALIMGHLEKAAHFCRQLESPPSELFKNNTLGRIYYLQGKYAEAVKHFSKVFPKDKPVNPPDSDSTNAYIKSLMETKSHEEALTMLNRVLERTPPEDTENRAYYTWLSCKSYQESNQIPKAMETMELLLTMKPSEELMNQALYALSRLYLASGQTEKASEKLTQLLSTSEPLWKAAAQQQLDSIQLNTTP